MRHDVSAKIETKWLKDMLNVSSYIPVGEMSAVLSVWSVTLSVCACL